ncbi:MFS transporter [Staphylococcus kloosii]|uniref:MFS transporter n=1 Tax=Staphylococcus kloosii TaxID=29384 RepID=UPI003982DFCB
MMSENMSNTNILPTKQRWSALLVLSISLFIIVMDMTILIMALPAIVSELEATAIEQLWIVDVYSLILAGLIVTMSFIGDRWGRKKILLLGFLIFGITSLMVLFVTSATQIIVIRAIMGMAGAMIMPTTLSMIRTIFVDAKERAIALSVWAGITGFGSVLGPIIGGLLLEEFSWHSTFLINVPIAILAIVFGLFVLPEYKTKQSKSFDLISAILSLFSMMALVWSIKSFSKEGLTHGLTWIIFLLGIALLIIFIQRNLRATYPLLDVSLFKNNTFTAGILSALISIFGMSALILLISQWLQLVQGLSPLQTGFYILPMAIGEIFATIIAPWLAQRIGARSVIVGGLIISGFGLIYMYWLPVTFNYNDIIPTLVMVGIGVGSLAVASTLIMSSTSVEKASSAAAIEETVYDLGNVLGVAILGSIATIIYRSSLDIQSFGKSNVKQSELNYANESIANTLNFASKHNLTKVYEQATHSFNIALLDTALIGGIGIVAIAIVIYFLIPKKYDITKNH